MTLHAADRSSVMAAAGAATVAPMTTNRSTESGSGAADAPISTHRSGGGSRGRLPDTEGRSLTPGSWGREMERHTIDDAHERDRRSRHGRPPSALSPSTEVRGRRRHRPAFRIRGPSGNALIAGCTEVTGLAEARTAAHTLRTRATPPRAPPTVGVGISEELELLFSVDEESDLPPEGHHFSGLIAFARFSPADCITASKVAERLCAPLFGDFARPPVRLPSQLGSMSEKAFLDAFDDQNNIVHFFVTTFGPGRCVALKLYAAAVFAARTFYLSTEAFGAQIANAPALVPNSEGDDGPPRPFPADEPSPLGASRRSGQHSEPRSSGNRSRSRRHRGSSPVGRSFSQSSGQSRAALRHQERRSELAIKTIPFMSDDGFDDNDRDLSIGRRITNRKLEIIGAAALLPKGDLASFFRAADRASTDQPYVARKPFANFVPYEFGTKSPSGVPVSEASRAAARAARIKAGPRGTAQVIQASHTFWASHAFAQDYLDPGGPAHHCALLLHLATNHGYRFAEAYETALQHSLVSQRSTLTTINLNEACFSLDREIYRKLESERRGRGATARGRLTGSFSDKSVEAKARHKKPRWSSRSTNRAGSTP